MSSVAELVNKLDIETRPFIGGKYQVFGVCPNIKKSSPIDGSDLPALIDSNSETVDEAVAIAEASYRSRVWIDFDIRQRKNLVGKFIGLLEDNLEELAYLDTVETGRPISNFLKDSIPKAIEAARYFVESIDKLYDYALGSKNSAATISREPIGVVGLITPWNDPLVVAMWKLMPALLVGNSVVMKPAEESSYSILKVASLFSEAGLPDGVFNVVTGRGHNAGRRLCMHKSVRGIFFTGSSEVGKKILTYAGQSNMKRVGLECGGKSPYIISDKCKDFGRAASVLARNVFYNQGQICSAPSRVIVHRSAKARVLEELKREMTKYTPGYPLDTKTLVGSLVSARHKARVDGFIQRALAEGLEPIMAIHNDAGKHPEVSLMPMIFDVDSTGHEIAREEIFGPVLVMLTVDDIEEAIEIANDSEYGLAAAIWTNDLDEAYHVSRRLDAGVVHINSYGEDDNRAPFGGVKQSGIGKDKSVFAFDEYSYVKTIWTQFV